MKRETRGTSVLDWILTNWKELVDEVKVVGILGGKEDIILEFILFGKEKAVCSQISTAGINFNRKY